MICFYKSQNTNWTDKTLSITIRHWTDITYDSFIYTCVYAKITLISILISMLINLT